MFVATHGIMRRQRRRLTMLATVLVLGGAVAAERTGMAEEHMGEAVAVCLAVAVVATTVTALPRLGRLLGGVSGQGSASLARLPPIPSQSVIPRARPSPVVLQVLRH